MNPSKNANTTWQIVNRTILGFDKKISGIRKNEKGAAIESIHISKEEALDSPASERERIMRLSRAEAIKEVLKSSKIENKISAIKSVGNNGLLGLA